MAGGLTLEQAQAAGFTPTASAAPSGGGLTLEQAQAAGFQPADPFATKHAEIPTPPKVEEPGFFSRALNTIQQGAHAIKTVGSEFAEHPIDTITDPSKRHQFERGMGDVLTAGLANKIAGAAGDALGDKGDANLRATEADDNARNPEYRTVGNVAGMVAPNPFNWAGGQVAGRVLAPVASKAVGKLPGAALGAARSVLGYEASAVPLAATQAAVNGENPIQAARDASTDPLGLMLSAGGGAVGGAATGKALDLHDPRKMSGRVLGSVERDNGQIKPFGEPIRGGRYEDPALADLKTGRAGMNEHAGNKEAEIKDYNREKLGTARQAYGVESDAILAEHADELHPATQTQDVLSKMEARAKLSSGKVADKPLHKFVQEVRDLISTETDQVDREHLKATGEARVLTKPEVQVGDLIKVKQMVADAAEWGSPATRDNAPYRLISHALSADAASVDPRIAELNKNYGATMEDLKAANDILYGRAAVDVKDSAAKSKGAALKLGRIGDDTQAATTDRLGELRSLDPKYEEVAQSLERKKNLERLRYGEPEVSTGFEKGQHRAVKHGVGAAVAKGVGAIAGLHVGGPIGAIAGAALPSAVSALAQNPLAVDLRLKLPVASAVARRVTGVKSGLSALSVARDEQRQRDAKRAASVGGR